MQRFFILLAACGSSTPPPPAPPAQPPAKHAKIERGHGPRMPEAVAVLNRLGKSAKVELATTSQYPTGTAARLPEHGCCGQPENLCPAASSSDPIWKTLDVSVDAGHFQYTYTSDGKTFHAEAVGDLDCDGTMITYALDGTSAQGEPVVTLTRPTNED